MSDMVERVAQAICGDDNPENICAIHRIRARAAIEAMREPTDQILCAGGEVLLDACSSEKGNLHPWKPFDVAQTAKRTFYAMIFIATSS